MFRSTTIIGSLHLSLAKVTFIKIVGKKVRHHGLCSGVLYRLFFVNVNLARLKCKLPDDGHRPKHVGAILIKILM